MYHLRDFFSTFSLLSYFVPFLTLLKALLQLHAWINDFNHKRKRMFLPKDPTPDAVRLLKA